MPQSPVRLAERDGHGTPPLPLPRRAPDTADVGAQGHFQREVLRRREQLSPPHIPFESEPVRQRRQQRRLRGTRNIRSSVSVVREPVVAYVERCESVGGSAADGVVGWEGRSLVVGEYGRGGCHGGQRCRCGDNGVPPTLESTKGHSLVRHQDLLQRTLAQHPGAAGDVPRGDWRRECSPPVARVVTDGVVRSTPSSNSFRSSPIRRHCRRPVPSTLTYTRAAILRIP